MVRQVRGALLSFIHPSPDFSEICYDGELKLLLFPITKTTWVTIDRSGIYNHLIPAELLQQSKMNLDSLPLFRASRTKEADKALLKIAERYVEMTGKSLLQFRGLCDKPAGDPWINLNKENK